MHNRQMEVLLAQGACNLGYTRRTVSFAMPSGGKGTASGPQIPQEMSMVDLWLPLKDHSSNTCTTELRRLADKD